MTYEIRRFFFNEPGEHEVLQKGVTLEVAQAWCNDPETSSETATSPEAVLRTAQRGAWFDGYQGER